MTQKRGFGSISKQRSGRYRARYTGPDGTWHNAPHTFINRMDAEAWLAGERRLISEDRWSPPADRKQAARELGPTLQEWCEQAVEARCRRARKPLKQTTADLYRKDLRLYVVPVLGSKRLKRLTEADVRSWWVGLDPSRPTANGRAYETLKSLLDDAVHDGVIAVNPCRIKGAGRPEPVNTGESLSVDELSQYFAAVPQKRRVMVMVAALCGLRSGEVRGLRRCDIDLDSGVLRVQQAVKRVRVDDHSWGWDSDQSLKTRAASRSVAMPKVLVAALREHLQASPMNGKDGLVFPAGDGVSPLNSSVLDAAHRKGREALDRPKLRIHDLRRTAATIAAQGGATTKELMRMLGHTTPNMAMRYQTADDQRDLERARRLDAQLVGAI